MDEIRIETEIDASVATVWEVLTDLPSYEEWNPVFARAEGDLREGETVDMLVKRTGKRELTMAMKVTTVDPPRRLQWVGKLLTPLLFEGRHTFELHELDGDRTLFVNHERFRGLLVPLLVTDDLRRDYEQMNQALADRVERESTVATEP